MTARGQQDLDDLDAVFAALAHHARRTILSVIEARGGEMTSGAIAERFEHSWSTTTRHLRVLERAGLVTYRPQGRERVYRIDAERLHDVAGAWIGRFSPRSSKKVGRMTTVVSGRRS